MPDDVLEVNYYSYDFTVTLGNVGGLAPTSAQSGVQIQSDANFLVEKMTFAAFYESGSVYVSDTHPYILAQINVQTSGTSFFDQPTPLSNFCGDGNQGFIMPEPRILLKNALVVMTATNFSTTNTYSLTVSLHGQKLFDLSS